MSEMADLQELQRQHHVFAEETFAHLSENFQIESEYSEGCELFQPYIGDAIVTISYIYRKDYRKIFHRLRQNLKHIKMFENYCMIVPVKKDERYFYYFLMRVSLIFELSLYCYNEGYDYFKIGQKCVAEYGDLQYFESVGGWGKLAHTALFIAGLGRPLTLIMYHDYNDRGKKIQTFHEAFSTLDKHLIHTGNLEMLDSAELHCLLELDKMFQTRKGKKKCGKKKRPEKENEFFEDFKISPKASSHYSKDSNCTIMAEYFKKCLMYLISSKALGYLMKDFFKKMPNVFNLSSTTDDESLTGFAKSCDPQTSTSHVNVDFSNKKVVYIEEYKTTSPVASHEIIRRHLVDEQLNYALAIYTDSSDPDMTQSDSYPHCSGKVTEILAKENLPLTESPEKCFPDRLTSTSENIHQKAHNYKHDKNLASRKERNINPTFIVPDKYFHLKVSGDTSKYMHLYAVKMCPPSSRKKLSEHMKKLLDENIENQNNDVLPSGDILVCPRESPANDTLIILAESSSDDEEVDENIDILICLFKKLEVDSLGSVLPSCSLRPRWTSLLEKDRSSSDLDRAGTTGEISTSDEESPLKTSRIIKSKKANFVDEKLYAKKLICLYKKHFTSILDEYFSTEFTAIPAHKCRKDSEIDQDDSKYVFAATASIMAKRKVLLDKPDETKRLIGIQLYKGAFEPKVLPLDVQRELDLQIEKGNFFSAPNGVYGVGPRCRIPRENIWVIFCTGNGTSEVIDYSEDDFKEFPIVFRSYEPVLQIFRPLPEDAIDSDMDFFETLLKEFKPLSFSVE